MSYFLLVTHKGQHWRYTLQTPAIYIGRGSENDITLIDERVSRSHARLLQTASGWEIEDLHSANGSKVNQQSIERAVVTPSDTIQIGTAILQLVELGYPQQDFSQTVHEKTQLDATKVESTQVDGLLAGEALDVMLPNTNIARLAIQLEGHTWEVPISEGGVTIGRAPDNQIVLNHPKVSRQHARIEWQDGSTVLVDLDSANGSKVNGAKVDRCVLSGREMIEIGGATLVYKPAFSPAQLLDIPPPSASSATPSSPQKQPKRKPIVFIPGFMGSQLWQGETLVWPDLKKLATQPTLFKLPESEPLTVKGLVEDVVVVPGLYKLEQYSQLTEFLRDSLGYESGKDLLEFAYDWRRDLRDSAQQLKTQIDAWRATFPDPSTKITVIAHSMGCLVTRYYIDVLGGDQSAERLILMGGPQQGSPKIVVGLLTGTGLLPFGLFSDKIREVLATFPSTYQLLPAFPTIFDSDDRPIDLFADDRWVQESYRSYLQNARLFRNELSQRARLPTLCIVGYGNKTVIKTKVNVSAEGAWSETQFVEDEEGDNNVPVHSGILEGADIHPVQQAHGALYADNDVKFRLKLELMK